MLVSLPMLSREQELLNRIKELEAGMTNLHSELGSLKARNRYLEEQNRLWQLLHFGPKSEKLTKEDGKYARLFDEAEDEAFRQELDSITEEEKEPSEKKKKSRKRGLNATNQLPDGIPQKEVVYNLTEEEKICGCGCKMDHIGYEEVKRLGIKPAEIFVILEKREKVACSCCDGIDLEDSGENAIRCAEGKKHIVPGGIASESLIAWSLSEKYEYTLPFYRQEKRFSQIGAKISRANLCNWAIKASQACRPLVEQLKAHIRSGTAVNADESHLQVLREKGRKAQSKSWMWLFVGGPPDKKAVYFHYDPGRDSDVPKEFLSGFSGYLQTDGYKAYNTALKSLNEGKEESDRIHHALCWAHARRRFEKCWKTTNDPHGKHGLLIIKDLFNLEKLRERMGEEEFRLARKKRANEIFNEFYSWAEKLYAETLPKSLLGDALSYTINNREGLERYTDHPELTPSNNIAENAVRPFVVGRKNYLFSATPNGAEASASIYSLIETAKLHGLIPYHYLLYVFDRILYANTPKKIEALLPWNLSAEMIIP